MAGCMYCMYIVLSIRYAGLLQKISILHFSWVSYSSLPILKMLLCGSAGTGWPLHWPQRTLLLHWVSDPCMHHLWDTSEWKALFGVQDMLTIHLLLFIPAAYKFGKIKLPSTCCSYWIMTSARSSGERAWALLWFQPGWYSSTNRQHLSRRHTVAGMGWHLEGPCKTTRWGHILRQVLKHHWAALAQEVLYWTRSGLYAPCSTMVSNWHWSCVVS